MDPSIDTGRMRVRYTLRARFAMHDSIACFHGPVTVTVPEQEGSPRNSKLESILYIELNRGESDY